MKREVLFEFVPDGPYTRVIAIDALTGIETTLIAPTSGTTEGQKQAALRKLAYVLRRRGIIADKGGAVSEAVTSGKAHEAPIRGYVAGHPNRARPNQPEPFVPYTKLLKR
jgi:hypothetical protein